MADVFENKLRVKLVTAFPIGEFQEKDLVHKIATKMQKEVLLEKKIDESIIGGCILKIGDKVIDNSIANSLLSLRKELQSVKS